jgi:hypothetical protein
MRELFPTRRPELHESATRDWTGPDRHPLFTDLMLASAIATADHLA